MRARLPVPTSVWGGSPAPSRRPGPQPLLPADVVDIGHGRSVRLLDVVGKGASAVVYRALLESANGLRKVVAFKLWNGVSSDDADVVFAHAATAASRGAWVSHPNVVETLDFGQWRRQPFMVLELVDGVSLNVLVERYAERSVRMPLDLALFIGSEVAEGLSGARTARDHRGVQLGMLHLALGTRKVMLGWRGEVKVGDFETSLAGPASSSVRSLRVVAYRTSTMAPEVAQGVKGDARSDVFSLGVMLRELFIGPRFPRTIQNAEAMRLAREGFVQPIAFQPHLPEGLVQVIVRALAVDPADRYPNASALAFELRRVALGLGVGDGRIFLRRALDREWGNDASEVTLERGPAAFSTLSEADIIEEE
ncbi:MAG: serine/threonine protein kinase [Labilithrix sp.]|nr:serine/threonine protein kinase [Labilithrix sp.]